MSVRFGLRLAAACFVTMAAGSAAFCQLKVGVISLQRAVLESAEIKKASADMEKKYQPRQQEVEKLNKEIQGIQQQLQTNAGKLTAVAQSDLTAEGQRKQRELQRMNDDLQADVNAERSDILGQSTKKMSEVVKKIAEEKGLDVVIDVSTTVYFKPALDITSEAIAAYDKAYPAK